jgi:hypothetical protein
MSVGRDKGKKKMTLSEIEAQKEHEHKEHREFRLKQAKDKIFLEDQKHKAPAEESESEGGETEDEQDHGKVPCNACRGRKVACMWSGTGRIKACDPCRGFQKSCCMNGVGHRAPRLKKARVIPDSEEKAGELTTPFKNKVPKAKSVPATGKSNRSGNQVGSGVVSEDMILHLRVPLVDMTRNLRRVVAHNAESGEEFERTLRILLDLLANLCGSMCEISYQLHMRNVMVDQAQDGDQSEVSESIQQVARWGEGAEVGIQVEPEEVAENSEVVENAEVMEKVGMENAGGEDETMEDA